MPVRSPYPGRRDPRGLAVRLPLLRLRRPGRRRGADRRRQRSRDHVHRADGHGRRRSPRRWPSGASGRATSWGSSRRTRRTRPRCSTASCAPTPSSPARTRSTRRASWPTSSPTPAPGCCSPSRRSSTGPPRRPTRPASPPTRSSCSTAADGFTSLRDLLGRRRPSRPRTPSTPATPRCCPYSSGTTGRAKGVILTHRNLVANLCQFEPVIRRRVRDHDPRRAAVLPHLRHDRDDEQRPAQPGHGRHDAQVRPGRVPPGHLRAPGRTSSTSPRRWRSRWPSTRWSTTTTCPASTPSSPAPPRSTPSSGTPWPSGSAARSCRATG